MTLRRTHPIFYGLSNNWQGLWCVIWNLSMDLLMEMLLFCLELRIGRCLGVDSNSLQNRFHCLALPLSPSYERDIWYHSFRRYALLWGNLDLAREYWIAFAQRLGVIWFCCKLQWLDCSLGSAKRSYHHCQFLCTQRGPWCLDALVRRDLLVNPQYRLV